MTHYMFLEGCEDEIREAVCHSPETCPCLDCEDCPGLELIREIQETINVAFEPVEKLLESLGAQVPSVS